MKRNSFTRTCRAIENAVDHARAGTKSPKAFRAKAKGVPIVSLHAVLSRLTRDQLRELARRFDVPRGRTKSDTVDGLARCGAYLDVSIW